MKIVLINTDPMVAKLIEATAKKTGIALISYASTDDLDIGTLTGECFVFVDEEAIGADKDRIKTIAQDFLSCMLYAKTKSIKEFSYLVKKPFLPTEILDILQVELLKVGQDLHNASEVTQDEIAQVDESAKAPELDMGMLDALADFDITQEFDDQYPLPPELPPVSANTSYQADNAADVLGQQVAQMDASDALDHTSDSLEDISVEKLEGSTGSDVNVPNISTDRDEALDRDLGGLSTDDMQSQARQNVEIAESVANDPSKDLTQDIDTLDVALESIAQLQQDGVGKATQEIGLNEVDSRRDTLDTAELSVLEDSSGVVESNQDDRVDSRLNELDDEADRSHTDGIANGADVDLDNVLEVASGFADGVAESPIKPAMGTDSTTKPESKEKAMSDSGAEFTQESQDSHIQEQNETLGVAGADFLESNQECEILPQDEVELVKTLLDDTQMDVSLESLIDQENGHTDIESISSSLAQDLDKQDSQYAPSQEATAEATSQDDADCVHSEEEFADIGFADLAQIEQEVDEDSSENVDGLNREDYLQLSESEIRQALGEELPTNEVLDKDTKQESIQEQSLSSSGTDDVDENRLESSESVDLADNTAFDSPSVAISHAEQDAQDMTEPHGGSTVESTSIELDDHISMDLEDSSKHNQNSTRIEARASEIDERDALEDMQDELFGVGTQNVALEQAHNQPQENLAEVAEVLEHSADDLDQLESKQDSSPNALSQEESPIDAVGDLYENDLLDSKDTQDLQELEADPLYLDSSTLEDIGNFGLNLVNSLTEEMQSIDTSDLLALKDKDSSLDNGARDYASNPTGNSAQANQIQAQLFSELLANKSAKEIRSLLNGAQISINISFSDKI